MGCDFYIYKRLVATWGPSKEGYTDILLDDYEKHYVPWDAFDSDDEFDEDAYTRAHCRHPKTLFRDGRWLITSRERIAEYARLLAQHNVSLEAEYLVVEKVYEMARRV